MREKRRRAGSSTSPCAWRYLTVGLTIAVFLVSVGMLAGGHVKFQAFPTLDGDVAVCRVLLPAGTPLARTERVVERLTRAADGRERGVHASPARAANGWCATSTVRFNENARRQGAGRRTSPRSRRPPPRRAAARAASTTSWAAGASASASYRTPSPWSSRRGPSGRRAGRSRSDSTATTSPSSSEQADAVRAWLHDQGGVRDIDERSATGEAGGPHPPAPRSPGPRADRGRRREPAPRRPSTARPRERSRSARRTTRSTSAWRATNRDGFADLDYFHVTLPDGQQVPLGTVASGGGVARLRAHRARGRAPDRDDPGRGRHARRQHGGDPDPLRDATSGPSIETLGRRRVARGRGQGGRERPRRPCCGRSSSG